MTAKTCATANPQTCTADLSTPDLSFEEVVRARRAVKHFDPAYQISAGDEARLFDIALQSPSSFNIQHWRIVKATDPALRKALRAAAWDQAQVTDASLLLVLCADVKAWEKNPERYWETAPPDVQARLTGMIKSFYQGRDDVQRDEAMRTLGILSQTLMLAAKAMGLDSCPMVGFDFVKVAELIRLPKDHVIGMMLTIGKGLTPARAKGGFLPRGDVLLENGF